MELPALLQGRLATCSIDQLLRMLTLLGDDVEIVVRPRLERTPRGTLRVLQAGAIDRRDDIKPSGDRRSKSPGAGAVPATPAGSPEMKAGTDVASIATRDERQLLNKHAVEKLTSLDITTIYRRMAAGTFPQPVRVGRRRVAWRTSDITQWERGLAVGTETLQWKRARAKDDGKPSGRRGR